MHLDGAIATQGRRKGAAKLILCDDHQVVLDGLRRVCEQQHDVVGVASSGQELLALLKTHTADCLLLDLGMPERHGLQLIGDVRRCKPDIKILVVTMHNDRPLAEASLTAGANGYIPKCATSGELLAAISEVLKGRRFVSERVPRSNHSVSLGARHPGLFRLTPRQQEIVLLMGEGKSCIEISGILHLGPSTITFHKHGIMRVLGTETDADLLRYAVLVRAGVAGDRWPAGARSGPGRRPNSSYS